MMFLIVFIFHPKIANSFLAFGIELAKYVRRFLHIYIDKYIHIDKYINKNYWPKFLQHTTLSVYASCFVCFYCEFCLGNLFLLPRTVVCLSVCLSIWTRTTRRQPQSMNNLHIEHKARVFCGSPDCIT